MTTTNRADLKVTLDRVNEATRLLRRSRDVPPEVERLVDALDRQLHADAPLSLEVDPSLAAALFAGALRAVKALRHDSVAAQRRELRVALEQVRHALRDVVDAAPFAADVPVREVLANLTRTVTVPQQELSDLLGVSTRQLQRWLQPDGPSPAGNDEARVRMVAQIVNELRHVFTAPGVVSWFGRSHPQLGEAPLDLLADPVRYPTLLSLARASRAMAA